MDIQIHHNDDGDIRLLIHRKPTHTDQYLLWTSEHPVEHKISVVRTLYDRATLITDIEDREREHRHIEHALTACQYPKWAIEKGRRQVEDRATTKKKKRT